MKTKTDELLLSTVYTEKENNTSQYIQTFMKIQLNFGLQTIQQHITIKQHV